MFVLYSCAFIENKNFLCNFYNYTTSNFLLFLFIFFLFSFPYSLWRAINSTSLRHRIEITVTLLAVLLAVSWIPVSTVTVKSTLTVTSILSYLILVFFVIYNHYNVSILYAHHLLTIHLNLHSYNLTLFLSHASSLHHIHSIPHLHTN